MWTGPCTISSERFAQQAFQARTPPPRMETALPGDIREKGPTQTQMRKAVSLAEMLDNCSVEVLEVVLMILMSRRSN